LLDPLTGYQSEELVENKGAYNAIVHESFTKLLDQIQAALPSNPLLNIAF